MAQLIPNYTGGVQGANSAVLPESNLALQTYLGLAQKNYNNKLLEHKKAVVAEKAFTDKTNFNTDAMRPIDYDPTLKRIEEWKQKAHDNPELVDTPNSDLWKEYDDINFDINKSKLLQKQLSYWKMQGVSNPVYRNDVEDLFNEVKRASEYPDIKTAEFNLPVPKPDFNHITYLKSLEPMMSTKMSLGKPENSGIGGVKKIPQTIEITPESAKNALSFGWDMSPEKSSLKKEYTSQYESNPDLKTQFPTAKDYYISSMLPEALAMGAKQSEVLHNVPDYDNGLPKDQTTIKFIAEKAHDLENPESDIYTSATVTTKDGKKKTASETDTFTGREVVVKDKTGKQYKTTIDKIYNIDGKLYAAPSKLRSKTGSVAIDDLIPITNIEDQIIVPYVNTEYGSSPNTAKLADNTLDYYRSLKGTKSSEPTTESGIKWK